MKAGFLFLALIIAASFSLVSCQSTGGHHGSGYHSHDDPIPSGVRYAQERVRRAR